MYKAIFLDIDGTIKDDEGNISNRVINSIKNISNTGIITVLCSGRNKEDTIKISRICGASQYVIILNGAEIFDYKKSDIMYKSVMKTETLKSLLEVAEDNNIEVIVSTDNSQFVCSKIEDIAKLDILQARLKLRKLYGTEYLRSTLNDINCVKIYELLRKEKIAVHNVKEADRADYFIVNKNTNKWEAIKYFCRKKNIDIKDIISIGDGENDIEMIENSGIGIAVSNANESVKERADMIIQSNNENGVALFLEELYERILKRKYIELEER